MNRKILNVAGFLAAAVLAVTMVADTQAGLLERLRNRGKKSEQRGSKTVAAVYNGPLRGDIRVGKQKVQVTDRTLVFLVGKGLTSRSGFFVKNRPVAVSGELQGGVLVAEMIVVRPEAPLVQDIHLSSSSSHRVVTKSESNPNVGIVEVGSEEE